MSAVDPTDVLALLEEKPYTEAELLALFETSSQILRFTLKALKRDGQLKQVGGRWALTGHLVPSAPASQTAPARRLPDVEDLDEAIAAAAEDLELADVADVIDEDEDEPPAPPVQRVKRQRRLYPVGTRQTAAKKAAVVDEPAWWVAHAAPGQRDSFQSAAAARNAEMSGKSPTWRTQTRPNSV